MNETNIKGTKVLTHESVRNLEYINTYVKEVLQLMPSGIPQISLIGEFLIKKGIEISIPLYTIMNDQSTVNLLYLTPR